MVVVVIVVGMEVWDVIMSDFFSGRVNLSDFCGVVFVGGFFYVDVFDSVKGWLGGICYNVLLK